MEHSKTTQRHAYEIPTPPSGPTTVSSGIKKDLPCSHPNCNDFCSPKCGFCEFHCHKFHDGIHYVKIDALRVTIPDEISRFLNLEKGDQLEWKMDHINGKHVSIISKNAKEHSDPEVNRMIARYNRISEEDIRLVAEQANVSLEEAKRSLIVNDNDLAKAILYLTTK